VLASGGPPTAGRPRVGRGRALLLGALLLVVLLGGGALLVAAIASGFDAGASSEAVAGHIDDFPPGSVTRLDLRTEAGSAEVYVTRPPGGDVLVLSRTSPFAPLGGSIGCSVAWRGEREATGPAGVVVGVFVDSCQTIVYDIEGHRLSGDAARDLDRYRVEVRRDGIVVVDLGDLRRQDRGFAR
jgi:hypothetical protein